jgi:thioredoxin-like negative regulator of GroEL
MVGPIMEELAAEANGRYRIAKLNVDENPRTAAQFQIQSIPTMLIFKNGQLVERLVGAQPKPAIAARLLTHVS